MLKVIRTLGLRAGTLNPGPPASRAYALNPSLFSCCHSGHPPTGWNLLAQSTRPLPGWLLPVFKCPVLLSHQALRFSPTACKPPPQTPYIFTPPYIFTACSPHMSKITVYVPNIFPWENSHSSSKNHSKVNSSPKSA